MLGFSQQAFEMGERWGNYLHFTDKETEAQNFSCIVPSTLTDQSILADIEGDVREKRVSRWQQKGPSFSLSVLLCPALPLCQVQAPRLRAQDTFPLASE